ncbi:MAG: 23S rRNA (guanosine(2251)-2'-O)-methyltransferase RlmB [Mollicutes bacterium]|mgnify:CR=1 FL=1|nr:23S rRNA (guanosine(2251)-2'-O)-methyltransferase RlmB [Mollicutes bacterium]
MYVYGKKVVEEILKNKKEIKKAYLYKKFSEKDIVLELQKRNIKIKYLEKFELNRFANSNHQGIILEVPDYEYYRLEDLISNDNALIVILNHLEDPHNLGAIIRTCEAASVDGIIIPKDRSVTVNATVMKVSAGALENVKIAKVTNLVNTIKKLKSMGFWIIGTDMEGTDYREIDYQGKIALVIGNEGKGISKLVKENCDFIASIPMYGKINSLNASVAAGIFIYEAINARR